MPKTRRKKKSRGLHPQLIKTIKDNATIKKDIITTVKKNRDLFKPDHVEPLEITFFLRSPVIMAHPWIHVDSLMAHLAIRFILDDLYYSLPHNEPVEELKTIAIPIKSVECNGFRLFHASSSLVEGEDIDNPHVVNVYTRLQIYKKFSDDTATQYSREIKKIPMGSGPHRGMIISLNAVNASLVRFYCLGDKHKIKKLLDGVVGIGKKVAIGFGAISKVEIKEDNVDRSLVDPRTSRAMRPIPVDLCEEHGMSAYVPYTFPYWDRRNLASCVIPGEKVKLKQEMMNDEVGNPC